MSIYTQIVNRLRLAIIRHLDLQEVFDRALDQGGYADSINYRTPPPVSLSDADLEWAASLANPYGQEVTERWASAKIPDHLADVKRLVIERQTAAPGVTPRALNCRAR